MKHLRCVWLTRFVPLLSGPLARAISGPGSSAIRPRFASSAPISADHAAGSIRAGASRALPSNAGCGEPKGSLAGASHWERSGMRFCAFCPHWHENAIVYGSQPRYIPTRFASIRTSGSLAKIDRASYVYFLAREPKILFLFCSAIFFFSGLFRKVRIHLKRARLTYVRFPISRARG